MFTCLKKERFLLHLFYYLFIFHRVHMFRLKNFIRNRHNHLYPSIPCSNDLDERIPREHISCPRATPSSLSRNKSELPVNNTNDSGLQNPFLSPQGYARFDIFLTNNLLLFTKLLDS